MGEKLGFARMSDFGGIVSYFLLLRDQATWKRRFKETKVRKQNPNFIFFLFLSWEKSPNLGKRGFIVSSPLLELFKLDSMVGYDIHEFRGSYLSFMGGKMAKSAITGQTPRIGTGTRSWYWYPW